MARDDYDVWPAWEKEMPHEAHLLTTTERIEEALGKLLMKFKELEDRITELEDKDDNLESEVAELRGEVEDFDVDRVEQLDRDLEELKETLRSV